MSKRTQTKRMRTQREILGMNQLTADGGTIVNEFPRYGKISGYLPPVEATIEHVMYQGTSMEVKILPGQRINLRREYNRQKKAGLI